MLLLHLHESLNLLIDNLHDILRHGLVFQVVQKLPYLLLFLVTVTREMLLEALVDLFELLLRLCLVALEIILLI